MVAKRRHELPDAPRQLDPHAPPWRTFRDVPTGIFVESVANHIRLTGQPETCEGLYTGKLPKDAKYKIIQKVIVDQRKRPESDRAPCPMCTPNRFLSGYLVWLPEFQCVSVVGHCCADHAEDAEREHKAREKFRKQEDYLFNSLPLLAGKLDTLKSLRGAASDADFLYRQFRAKAPGVLNQLNGVKEHQNAILTLTETIDTKVTGGHVGPAGFRGRGEAAVNSRDVLFGRLSGTTSVLRSYRPKVELEDAIRSAEVFGHIDSEEAALNLITMMTPNETLAAIATVQAVDRYHEKFSTRIQDFAEFWSEDNIKRVNEYGTSPLNPTPFEARRTIIQTRPVVVIRQEGKELRALIPARLSKLNHAWKAFSYRP